MKLQDILLERISDVVYHSTSIHNALSILDGNRFILSLVSGTSAEKQHTPKLYYLSTTRSKLGSYHRNPMGTAIIFKLDGGKLSQKYSGNAVDYWGPEFRKIDPAKNEMEDRVFSDEPYIENAASYITEIHIYVNLDEMGRFHHNNTSLRKIRKIFLKAKQAGISTYFYDDKKSWGLQAKGKAIKPTPEILGKGADLPGPAYSRQRRKYLSGYVELYYVSDYDKLSKEGKKVYADITQDYFDEAKSRLGNDLHNMKGEHEEMKTLMAIWRKEKINSVEEYIKLLKDKWVPKEKAS